MLLLQFDVEEFAYPARPQNRVCNGYKLSVKAGETVALVGPSGGGERARRSPAMSC